MKEKQEITGSNKVTGQSKKLTISQRILVRVLLEEKVEQLIEDLKLFSGDEYKSVRNILEREVSDIKEVIEKHK